MPPLGTLRALRDQFLIFFPLHPRQTHPHSQPMQPAKTGSQPGTTRGVESGEATEAAPSGKAGGASQGASVGHKLAAGLLGGATATAVTNPFELAKVRTPAELAFT